MHSTSGREGGSQSHPRQDQRGRQQSDSVRAGGTHHSGGYSHRFQHGPVSHDRSVNTDGSRDRKRSRHDTFTNRNNGPDTKKFRHSRESSHGHPGDNRCHGNHHRTCSYPKDDHCHGNYHKTSTYLSQERDYCSSRHASDSLHYRKRGDHERSPQYLPQEFPRMKSGHEPSHQHGSKIPSHRSRSKWNRDDAPYKIESRLPVGGATSSSSTFGCEVVPYTSSEASCSSGCSGNNGSQKVAVSVVMSIQGCNLVPSLPEMYYRCDDDGVSAAV